MCPFYHLIIFKISLIFFNVRPLPCPFIIVYSAPDTLNILYYSCMQHPSLKGSGQSILTLKSHSRSQYLPMSWGLSCMVIWLIPCSLYDFLNPLELFSPPHTCHVETIAFYSSLYPKCPSLLRKCSFTWATVVSYVYLCHSTVMSLFIVSLFWETVDFLHSFEQTPLLLNVHDQNSVLCTG